MEAVINNTKLIRRVNIFALLILAVCVCAVAFFCKNMWLHIACTAALFLVMTIFGYWGKGLKFLVAFLISYGMAYIQCAPWYQYSFPHAFTFLIELSPSLWRSILFHRLHRQADCCPPATAASVLRKADGDCHTAFCSNGGFGVF